MKKAQHITTQRNLYQQIPTYPQPNLHLTPTLLKIFRIPNPLQTNHLRPTLIFSQKNPSSCHPAFARFSSFSRKATDKTYTRLFIV